jgi:Pyruvate/2-oxoacid:ferredoxin oxidoreductase delta subunit
MTTGAADRIDVQLYEGEGAAPAGGRVALVKALLEKGYRVRRGGEVPGSGADRVILGRFEGGTPPAALADVAPERVHPLPAGGGETAGVEEAVAFVEQARAGAELPVPGKWKPWFPVIDHDRCTDCMQCLSFCLFGVYGVNERGGIKVQNQDRCKTDCPACSRVCPEVAILFPKYGQGPINGAEIQEEDLRREAMKVDISALLGGDVYQALRDRSEKAKSRFSKERDDGRALAERQKCLGDLKKQMDIPDEVLAALPSLSEIQRRAETARTEAERALRRQDSGGE